MLRPLLVALLCAVPAAAGLVSVPVTLPRVSLTLAAPAAAAAALSRPVLPALAAPVLPTLAVALPAPALAASPAALALPAAKPRAAQAQVQVQAIAKQLFDARGSQAGSQAALNAAYDGGAWRGVSPAVAALREAQPNPAALYPRAEREAARASAAHFESAPVRFVSASMSLPASGHLWDYTFQVEHGGRTHEVFVRFEADITGSMADPASRTYIESGVRPSAAVGGAEAFAAGAISLARALDAAEAGKLAMGRRVSVLLQPDEAGRLVYWLYSETGATAKVDAATGTLLR